MARGQRTNTLVNPLAAKAMQQFKYEIASELGINPPEGGYWGEMTTRDTGAIGGNMVRRMVEDYENRLASGQTSPGQPTGGGQAGGTTGAGTGNQGAQKGGGPSRTQY